MLPPYAQERELSHRHRTHHHTLVVITLIIIVVIVIIPRSITMPMAILVIIIIILDIIMVITLNFIPQWLALHLMDFPHPRLFAVLLSLRGKTEARLRLRPPTEIPRLRIRDVFGTAEGCLWHRCPPQRRQRGSYAAHRFWRLVRLDN